MIRFPTTLTVLISGLLATAGAPGRTPPSVQPNPNTQRAGTLHAGVLTVTLEAKETLWHLNGPNRPPMRIEAFAEPGKPALMPGPLVRAPAGTELRLSIRNSLGLPLTFFVPASIHGGPDRLDEMDSVVVAPGATQTLAVRATVPGNYVYRAATRLQAFHATRIAGLLTGALIVDTANADPHPRDHVFVILETFDSLLTACADTTHSPNPGARCPGRAIFTINGRSWPDPEPVTALAGDSLHWRVLNASPEAHPMHLHGFYYRVDAFSGPHADLQGRPAPGQSVVTQLMTPLSTMSMTWAPDRPGNWLFHCHFAVHLQPDSISAAPDDPHMREMVGLVLLVKVGERAGVRAAGEPSASRRLRLVAMRDSASPDAHRAATDGRAATAQETVDLGAELTPPVMHFALEEHGRRVDMGRDLSPVLNLTRGEPVAITIVNRLDEPTSVHWHGIEIEDSYYDGAPGMSGLGKRLSPAIAPGDSFVARFTPPRSGTFMYHAHIDELREESGGLEGALIVRDPGAPPSPDDHVFFLKDSHLADVEGPLEINGQLHPDTVVLHVGTPARLRILSLTQHHYSLTPVVSLTARADVSRPPERDTGLARWRPIAKDGADLPGGARTLRDARQMISMGETYDFEYTPHERGMLYLDVRPVSPVTPLGGRLLIRVPIRVE